MEDWKKKRKRRESRKLITKTGRKAKREKAIED
jgi:hypothetical protein